MKKRNFLIFTLILAACACYSQNSAVSSGRTPVTEKIEETSVSSNEKNILISSEKKPQASEPAAAPIPTVTGESIAPTDTKKISSDPKRK